jgi:hypothetical protein
MMLSIDVPEADWGGAATANIVAVVCSVAGCFDRAVCERPIGAVRVEPTPTVEELPISLFKRAATGHVRVLLSARGTFWAQFAYQFAHELCHVLANFREPFHHPSKWIEESLCETSSLFAITVMSQTWQTTPPYPNWKAFAPALRSYYEERCAEPLHHLPEGTAFCDWLRSHHDLLRSDSVRRADNTVIARQLLPIFAQDGDAWRAVRYLNLWDATQDSSVERYCQHWRGVAPQLLHSFVDAVERRLTGQ